MLNDHFDKIFIINLDSRVDRLTYINSHIKFPYERFSAINGATGIDGCRLSHLEILKESKRRGYKRVLICEDDLIINERLYFDIDSIMKESSLLEYDILYFHQPNWKLDIINHKYKTVMYHRAPFCTHCYCVNNIDAVIKLIESNNTSNMAIDYIYVNSKLKTLLTKINYTFQKDGFSDVLNEFKAWESYNINLFDMNELKSLCFEINGKCNLKKEHLKCPINVIKRSKSKINKTDIIGFLKYCKSEWNFNGEVGFHYYNEPLISIIDILEIIKECIDNDIHLKFKLWTNGLLIPKDIEKTKFLSLFSSIIITNYYNENLEYFNKLKKLYNISIINGELDNRLDVNGADIDILKFNTCYRQEHELIVRNDGEIIHCCVDMNNEIKSGNILSDSYEECINNWFINKMRVSFANKKEFYLKKLFKVCKKCDRYLGGLKRY